MDFSIISGAYFIETNGGGENDFSKPNANVDPTIAAYRANAACAQFSRVSASLWQRKASVWILVLVAVVVHIARLVAWKTQIGVWDGAVPYVLGSPMAIPNVFTVRMHAMRILHDKFPGKLLMHWNPEAVVTCMPD